MAPKPMPPLVRGAVDRFHDTVREHFQQRLREFVLFGSQARGDAHSDSDVDILVIVDALSEDERKVVFDLAYDAGAAGDELIVLSPLPYSTLQAQELRRRERRCYLNRRSGIPGT